MVTLLKIKWLGPILVLTEGLVSISELNVVLGCTLKPVSPVCVLITAVVTSIPAGAAQATATLGELVQYSNLIEPIGLIFGTENAKSCAVTSLIFEVATITERCDKNAAFAGKYEPKTSTTPRSSASNESRNVLVVALCI